MASTTIKTTALDFDNIKESLKTHLQSKSEFADYDFEAAGLSNLLDVLAYNTHYNGLIANFALNESYLTTAQLRSSMVSLAETMGYIPSSTTSSQGVVNLSINLAGVSGRPSSLQIDSGSIFTSSVDGTSYTFQNLQTLTATDNGSGLYEFANLSGDEDIILTEGVEKSKQFVVGTNNENVVYVIPDTAMDTSTVSIKVYQSLTSTVFDEYSDVLDATSITSQSKVYFLKESPNGQYELSFGDGTTFGAALSPGNVIKVTYLRSNGTASNGATAFTPSFQIAVGSTSYDLTCTTVTASAGGSPKEGIESIRKNAPYQFSAQNRMVTSGDYSTIILREFPSYITDIRSYGGEDAPEPKYGTVYLSILFDATLPDATVASVKTQINALVKRLAIASFDVEFIDPVTTYIGVQSYFQYNPSETPLSQSKIEESVNDIITAYFDDNLGLFDTSFRRSNMLTLVDDSSTAILSSRADIVMVQRIEPTLNALNEFSLSFPAAIAGADDTEYSITSSYFVIDGKTCIIRNALEKEKLEVYNVTDGEILIDNVGYYTPSSGAVVISGLEPDSITGGVDYIKIKATPSNQSAITPTLNNVLKIDANETFSTGVQTSAVN